MKCKDILKSVRNSGTEPLLLTFITEIGYFYLGIFNNSDHCKSTVQTYKVIEYTASFLNNKEFIKIKHNSR